MIIQMPDEPTPAEAGYFGSWEVWSHRAIMYALSSTALPAYSSYSGNFIGSTITAGSSPLVLYSEEGGDSRLYQFKSQTAAYVVPADFDPVKWELYTTNITIVERQKAANTLTASDYTIGTTIPSGTHKNKYVAGILVPGGKFWGVLGGKRPDFITGGVQGDRIRNITGGTQGRGLRDDNGGYGAVVTSTGAFTWDNGGSGSSGGCWDFNASHVVPTGPDNAPTNASYEVWRRTS
jgi:hypothetical protein